MADNPLLQSALHLAAEYRLPVFPLVPGAKTPAVKDWQDAATTDPERITKIWSTRNFNIGVLCGAGVIGIDIDVKDGKQGLESWDALGLSDEDKNTLVVKTPTGGFHVYYLGDNIGNSASSRLGPGVDTRGSGGYLVGPGSRLTNGSGSGSYEIVRARAIHKVPQILVDRFAAGRRHDHTRDLLPVVDLDDPGAVARGRRYLQEVATPAVQSRGGDDATFRVAAVLKDYGLSESVACELMLDWNERCIPPWTLEDLQTKVRNAYLYGASPPGSEHPAVAFSGVTLEPAVVPRPDSPWTRQEGERYADEGEGWLFQDIASESGLLVLVGPTNGGKTFLLVELARCQATGKPFFGVKPDAIGGVGFLFTGSEGVGFRKRLAALNEGPLPISGRNIQTLGERSSVAKLEAMIREESERMMTVHGVPMRMVVLETLSSSGLVQDENNNAQVAVVLAELAALGLKLGMLIVTTHHPPKDGKGARGAGAITNNPACVMEIHREGRESLRSLEIIKARDAGQRMLGTFTLVPVVIGLDRKGRTVSSLTVSMGDAVDLAPSRQPGHAEAFNRALEFAIDEALETIEGLPAAPEKDVLKEFKGLTTSFSSPGSQNKAFHKCLDFALSLGAIDQRAQHGVKYVLRRETIGD